MELKQIEKANKLYTKIKVLDSEIAQLDKLAQEMVNDNMVIRFDLKAENKSKAPKEKATITEDGLSLHMPSLSFSFLGYGQQCEPVKPKHETKLNKEVSESVGLELLAVLLRSKIDERTTLIKKLQAIL